MSAGTKAAHHYGIAAGNSLTAAVGRDLLLAGGTAVDAAIGAVLASCAAETILTGLGGAGFATCFDAATREPLCLDFFCSVPGLQPPERPERVREMTPVAISFGEVPLSFSIGGPSVGVPGILAGLGGLHSWSAALPWSELLAPAIRLAERGVALSAPHADTLAAIAPAMLAGEGASVYAPTGHLLSAGGRVHHRCLAQTMATVSEQGPGTAYTGSLAEKMVRATVQAGGTLCEKDLTEYQVSRITAEEVQLNGYRVVGRHDIGDTLMVLSTLPPGLAELGPEERAIAVADALVSHTTQRYGSTTSLSVVDARGNACVVTTTLGVGSGVWVPETGIHLNSMLGEAELALPHRAPGERLPSNICPLIVLDDTGGVVLALGAAGASRIRSSLVHTLIGVLVEGLDLDRAISRPRFHPIAETADGPAVVHSEPGYPESELQALEKAGYTIHRWNHRSYYFGAVNAVGTAGACGDPRRGGAGVLLS